jgi:hypothetical protein
LTLKIPVDGWWAEDDARMEASIKRWGVMFDQLLGSVRHCREAAMRCVHEGLLIPHLFSN